MISPWFVQECRVDGFRVFRLERSLGPNTRDDYEFALGEDGQPLNFSSREEAAEALDRLRSVDLLFCSLCGADVEEASPACSRCGGNPAAETIPCPDCKGSGTVVYASRCGRYDLDPETCPRCRGEREVQAPYLEDRDLIAAQLRRQRRAA